MRKKLLRISMATIALAVTLLAGLVILAGCEEEAPSPKGVIGQITGVVFDNSTALPIKGVKVKLGTFTKTTDDNGVYTFDNIPVGEYTVTFSLNGYLFKTANIKVDEKAYKDADPLNEMGSIQSQYDLLLAWIKKEENRKTIPDFPDLTTGSTFDFTYQDGIWISGDGKIELVFNNDTGTFKVPDFTLNKYTWKYGISMYAVGLTPLNGTLSGEIKLFTTPLSAAQQTTATAVDLTTPVSIWLVTADDYEYEIGADGAPIMVTGMAFGPIITSGSGKFVFSNLPLNTEMKLVISGFHQDGKFFKGGDDVFNHYDFDANEILSFNNVVKAFNNAENTEFNIGVFYLITAGTFATVTDGNTGLPNTQIAGGNINSTITLTFNSRINPSGFSVDLILDADNGAVLSLDSVPPAAVPVPLTVDGWADNNTVVTLSAKAPLNGYVNGGFPYSKNGSIPVGRLAVRGFSLDGAKIYADESGANGIPVYTSERLKLVKIEVAPTDIPPRSIVVSADAIKLTFNKPLDRNNAAFSFNETPADYRFSDDSMSVFVYTDLLTFSGGTAQELKYTVASSSNPFDILLNQETGLEFLKASSAGILRLMSTNIYDNRTSSSIGIDGEYANFPIGSEIKLTFSRPLVEGTDEVRIFFTDTIKPMNEIDAIERAIDKTITYENDRKTIVIKPTGALKKSTDHFLQIQVFRGREVFFDGSKLVYSFIAKTEVTPVAGTYIKFKTEEHFPHLVIDTINLYSNRPVGEPIASNGSNANFPIERRIVITLLRPVPAGSVIQAALVRSETGPSSLENAITNSILSEDYVPGLSSDGRTITIVPENSLEYNTWYKLALNIYKEDGNEQWSVLNGVVGHDAALSDASDIYRTVSVNGYRTIAFRTIKDSSLVALTLSSTNIYEKRIRASGQLTAESANFPVSGTPISLTFTSSIPTGATVKVALVPETAVIITTPPKDFEDAINGAIFTSVLTPETNRRTITISKDVLPALEYDTEYFLAVDIVSGLTQLYGGIPYTDPDGYALEGSQITYGTPRILDYAEGYDLEGYRTIKFFTEIDPAYASPMFKSTNIYDNRLPPTSHISNAGARFPVNAGSTIELNFVNPISTGLPVGSFTNGNGINAVLVQGNAVQNNWNIAYSNALIRFSATNMTLNSDRTKITLTLPVALQHGTDYQLAIQIQKEGRQLFGGYTVSLPEASLHGMLEAPEPESMISNVSSSLLVSEPAMGDYRTIRFRTITREKITLIGTNIYNNVQDITIPDADINFPVMNGANTRTITLTFNNTIPAGARVEALLNAGNIVETSWTNAFTNQLYHFDTQTNPGKITVSGVTVTLTPDVPERLTRGASYHLILRITMDGNIDSPIFHTNDLDGITRWLNIGGAGTIKGIIFTTASNAYTVLTSLRPLGSGSFTAPEFTAITTATNTLTANNLEVNVGTTANRWYNIQFSGAVQVRALDVATPPAFITVNSNVFGITFRIARVAGTTNMLRVAVMADAAVDLTSVSSVTPLELAADAVFYDDDSEPTTPDVIQSYIPGLQIAGQDTVINTAGISSITGGIPGSTVSVHNNLFITINGLTAP